MFAYQFEKKLIEILKANRDRYLSEEALLKNFGLAEFQEESTESAQDISRAVEILRLQGYEIDGDQTGGWTLVSLPDMLNHLEVESALRTTFLGKCLFTYRIIGSTNSTARMLAEAGVPDGALLVTEEQSRGRGRYDKSWYSPPGGGIWASLILRPGIRPAQLGSLGMLAALSICLAIEENLGLKPRIKWPNDLCLEGKKLAGVLCEAGCQGEELKYVVLGFGVNVNIRGFPPELAAASISLHAAAGRENIYRVALLAEILDKLEEGYFKFLTDGFAAFLPRVQVRDFLRDRKIRVQLAGGPILSGIARGVDEHGALLLETSPEGHLKTITQGQVIEC